MNGRILVLAAALTAAGSLGLAPASHGAEPAVTTAAAPQDALDGLVRDLSSPDADRRASAACQIGEMGPRAASAVSALAAMLSDATEVKNFDCGEHDKNERGAKWREDTLTVGEVAAVALARIGDPSFEVVIGALGGADWRARMNAAFSLGLFGGDRSVEPLVAVLGDSVADVRGRAAWALGLQGDRRAVEPLASALEDASDGVRSQAAWALGLKGDERSVEPLIRSLEDSSPKVRSQAAWALGLKGDNRAVESLIRRLEDEDATVQSQSAWALGLKGDRRAEAPLTRALKSPSAEVRRQAAWALGMIGMRDGREGPRINPNPRPDVSIRP
jgi:HEAT repeat protein